MAMMMQPLQLDGAADGSALERKLKDEINELRAQVKSYKLDLSDAAEDKRALQAQLEALRKGEEKPKPDLSSLRQKFADKDKATKSLLDLKSEIAIQLQHMKEDKFDADMDDEGIEEMRKRYEEEKVKSSRLQIEIDRLNLELQAGHKWQVEFETAKAKIKEIKKKKKEAKAQAREMKKEVDTLIREKTEAEEDKTLLSSELEGSKQQLQTLLLTSSSNLAIPRATDEYDEKLARAEAERKQMEENIQTLREELEKKKDELEKKESERIAIAKAADHSPAPKDKGESKKHDKALKEALAKKEKMQDEIKSLKSRVKDLESKKHKLQAEVQDYKQKLADSNMAGLVDREKELTAEVEKLKALVEETESKSHHSLKQSAHTVSSLKTKMEMGRAQLAALKEATVKLLSQADARRERLASGGIDDLGLLEVLEEDDDKLTLADEEMIKKLRMTERALDKAEVLAKTLASKLDKAKQKNKARLLIEVKELLKDITSRLTDKLSAKAVDKELARSAEVLGTCKKLNLRLIHELEVLQGAADGAEGIRSLRYGWWRMRGSNDRAEGIEDCVKFLVAEAGRLSDIRDKYVLAHNKVAALCEVVSKAEKDLMKWKFGLEELQDRVTLGAGWGHAALASRLLACRRLLDRHYAARTALDNAKSRRATLSLTLDSFAEGLCIIFDEELAGLGAKGISELTRIRNLEGQILTVREELEDAHEEWMSSRSKQKTELHQSHAGVVVVETLIKNFESFFEAYNDDDVPEIVIKCVDYILDKALKDRSLLLRDYDLPKIDEIKAFFDAGTYDVDLSDCTDHRVVSELLKSYLRDTHDSVLTSNLHDEWVKVDEIVDDKDRLEAITSLLRKLPSSNFATLAAVIELLREVSDRSHINNCNRRLLARVFGPLMLRKSTTRR